MRLKGRLTSRQLEVLSFINEYITEYGYPPTLVDLRYKLSVTSNQTVLDFLTKLVKFGFISRNKGSSRSITITMKGYSMLYSITSYDYGQIKEEGLSLREKGDESYEENPTKVALFKDKKIRRVIHNNEWWFAVVDIIEALTDSTKPRDYWYRLKQRELESSRVQLSTFCRQLKIESSDGKKYDTEMSNTEGIFRIIQSIPSPKAEPFKRWLAKVGYERVQEIEDPELASKRARAIYKAKGYSEAWIEKRMRGIQIREELTNEWKNRGIGVDKEFAILTAEISRATFDMTP